MAAAVSSQLGVDAELVQGDKGVFDVIADDALVFSKYKEGRFPEAAEIIQALRALQ